MNTPPRNNPKDLDPLNPDRYASRGGAKLAAAIHTFNLNLTNKTAADLGCSVGGFTDCLLQNGCAHVTAVDTAYGQLAWKLRQDPRVTVLERTNAIHYHPANHNHPPVDSITLDLSWNLQHLAIPAALRWAKPSAHIITLIKPHYEAKRHNLQHHLTKGILPDHIAKQVLDRTLESLPSLGINILNTTESPIRGSKGKTQGNTEYLAHCAPRPDAPPHPSQH